MLTSIFHAAAFNIQSVALALGSALALGMLIAWLYRSIAVSKGFPVILAILPFLVASVIMIVNGNFGASVAVLGAFGLVRFRSAAGSAKEIGFIFFAMAVGLAAGMGFLSLAAVITVTAGGFLLLLEKTRFGEIECKDRMLKITIPEDLDYDGLFDDLFLQYTKRHSLERVKTTNMGTMYELDYRIEMRDIKAQKKFIDALRCRNGNLTVILGLVQREKNEL